jgi:hypothetical protein
MKLTTRGWIVLVIIPAFLALIGFTYLTRDVCWVGNGYGSCTKLIDEVTSRPHKIDREFIP